MAGTWADGQIVQNDARHALCAIDCHGHGFRNKLKRNALFADVSGASNWITHSSYRRVIPVASWQKGFESMGQRRVVRMTQKSRPNVAPERSCFLEPGTWGTRRGVRFKQALLSGASCSAPVATCYELHRIGGPSNVLATRHGT